MDKALELADYIETGGENIDRKELSTMLRQQQAEIKRLIGAKPITYGMLTFCKNCGEQNPYQAKTLTDEEIIKIYEDMLGVASAKSSAIDFVRAILRKAQEK